MYSIRNDKALKQKSLYVKEFILIYGTAPRMSPLTLFGRHDRFCQPLRPRFAKETAFFSVKAQKLQKATLFALFCKAEFLDSMSVLALELGTLFGALAHGF